jgi:hypothetical protein
MSKYTLRNGIRRTISSVPEEQNFTGENTVSVSVTGGVMPWMLHFWARIGTSRVYVGAVRVFAAQQTRLVAIVSIPGAKEFEVEGKGNNAATDDELAVEFEGIEARGGPWGVHPIPGNSVNGARSYRVLTGTNGSVVVTGEVWGWAAYATAAAATVAVAALPGLGFGPIGVPINGSVQGDARGILAPVSTWTFTNTSGFLIEFFPPGGLFDG